MARQIARYISPLKRDSNLDSGSYRALIGIERDSWLAAFAASPKFPGTRGPAI